MLCESSKTIVDVALVCERRFVSVATVLQDHGIENVTALHATYCWNFELGAGVLQIHADMTDQESSASSAILVKGLVGH